MTLLKKYISEALESHILNFYEDLDMQIGELYEVIDAISEGKLEDIQEKMDGQNITFSVIDENLRFFTKGTSLTAVQKGGATRETLVAKYSEKPGVRDAFLLAYDSLAAVVEQDIENANKLFQNGKVLIEAALLTPSNPNTIIYDEPHIRFIQPLTIEKNVSIDYSAYAKFTSDASVISKTLDKKVEMGTVPILRLKQSLDASHEIDDVKSELSRFIDSSGGSKNNTIEQISIKLVKKLLDQKGFNTKLTQKMAHRLVTGEKGTLTKNDVINTSGQNGWKVFQEMEEERSTIVGESIIPLERIVQKIGVIAFRNLEFALASNKREKGDELRSFVKNVRKAFQQGNIVADKTQLERIRVSLDRIGENEDLFEKAVEGIVFRWKGKTRKLTGLFTPINKLRGFFNYGSSPAKIKESALLGEGGNVFKTQAGKILTTEIRKDDVESTLTHFKNAVLIPLGINDYAKIGSTGKKQISGDIDIAIEVGDQKKKEFKEEFTKNVKSLIGNDKVKIVGSNLAIMYPIVSKDGAIDNGYVQIDIMLADDISHVEWMMTGADESHVPGVYRNLLLSYIAKVVSEEQQSQGNDIKITVSFPNGLSVKRGNEISFKNATNPEDILRFLGINAKPKDIQSFESLVDYLVTNKMTDRFLVNFKSYIELYEKKDQEGFKKALDYISQMTHLRESIRELLNIVTNFNK